MSVLTTQRLVLREVKDEDCVDLQLVLSDAEVMRYSVKGVHSQAQIREYITTTQQTYKRLGFGQWIVTTTTGEFVGICGLNKHMVGTEELIHIMYRLAPSQQGKGFATEAVHGVLSYAETALTEAKIHALIEPSNLDSIKVIERAGLVFDRQVEFAGSLVNLYQAIS